MRFEFAVSCAQLGGPRHSRLELLEFDCRFTRFLQRCCRCLRAFGGLLCFCFCDRGGALRSECLLGSFARAAQRLPGGFLASRGLLFCLPLRLDRWRVLLYMLLELREHSLGLLLVDCLRLERSKDELLLSCLLPGELAGVAQAREAEEVLELAATLVLVSLWFQCFDLALARVEGARKAVASDAKMRNDLLGCLH